MGVGHFVCDPENFDWEAFKKHMQYTDEELKAIKNNPIKVKWLKKVCSPEMQNKYLIAEVVESHGCLAGLRPGDRIFFKGLTVLDPELSDPWCPYIANVYWFTYGARNLFVQGLDPDSFYVRHSGCLDVGPQNGLGRVIYKVFVVDKDEVYKYLTKKGDIIKRNEKWTQRPL